jgi:hypothetical protein
LTTFTRRTTLPRLYANQVIYAFRRFGLPPDAARQLTDNAIPRSLLPRSAEGAQLVRDSRALVFDALGLPPGTAAASIAVPASI